MILGNPRRPYFFSFISGFPTRDDLERYRYIRKRKKSLAAELINTTTAGRDYQIQTIRKVMEPIEKKHTKFLLGMATGTGKTRTCIALVDVLIYLGPLLDNPQKLL